MTKKEAEQKLIEEVKLAMPEADIRHIESSYNKQQEKWQVKIGFGWGKRISQKILAETMVGFKYDSPKMSSVNSMRVQKDYK